MAEVEKLVALERRLSMDERMFVLEHYQEGAHTDNAAIGAFFTPCGLARDFSLDVSGATVVDLCAGIGALAFACESEGRHFTCVEQNAEYVRVGRKVMPDATWIHSDVFGYWWKEVPHFDMAIANPPFGRIRESTYVGAYTGGEFEYKVIDLALRISDRGAFIVPQQSAPFRFSGARYYERIVSTKCAAFLRDTGICLEVGAGVDTSIYRDAWHGVSPICEIVLAEFPEGYESEGDASHLTTAEVPNRASEMIPITGADPRQLDMFATI
ncbi:methyltransferase [Pandoraea cepalis]|uniref:Methyltransferase n=2 Tax=Pandoraea cepalis TaxID=2508294 RepID=A0AAW7MGR8_9BURK|nr:methyltransferase [Pandoraea cepalis]MDN4581363.1 methyltransferase [Pandoraea cepalis]